MDRDFLIDLFAKFGPVDIKRMFSGFGISADGVTFALALRAGLFLRADEATIAQFEAEGCKPFDYDTKRGNVVVRSYWQTPERLFDDPDEFAGWAERALAAARRAAASKPAKRKRGLQPPVKKSNAKKSGLKAKSKRKA